MKKSIGFIVAIETEAMFEFYKDIKEIKAPVGYSEFEVETDSYTMHILKTGMGEIAASAGVQYLITKYDVSVIFNFGVVGGLTDSMKKHKTCLVERVVHYKYDCSEFMDLAVGQVDGHSSVYLPTDKGLIEKALSVSDDLMLVTCCSGDKFVGTAEEKTEIHNKFDGDICDMESAGIVLACELNGVPCMLFKAVSDGLSDGAEGFYNELKNASLRCLEVADRIINSIV